MANLFHEDGNFVKALHHYVKKEGFTINEAKTRVNSYYQRQEVTGLTINEKPNVTQKYVKQIRTMLHNWEVNGYEFAQSEFLKHYHTTKYINFKGEHHIENVISGKLDFMKMVKGEKDGTYRKLIGEKDHTFLKLKERFDRLTIIDVSGILDVWEKEGIDDAMDLFMNVKKHNGDE